MSGLSVNFNELTQSRAIQQEWLDLQGRAECSYFQSWGWISNWLNQIVDDRQVMVLRVWSDQLLVGMGLFVPADIKRRLVVRSKALFLNEYPFAGKNMVIEYNGILAACDFEQAVYKAAVNYFTDELNDFDEFYLGGVPAQTVSRDLVGAAGPSVKFDILEESNTWQVLLSREYKSVDCYLSTLSKNRRGQIRRSIRLYEERGPVTLRVAETCEEAMAYFSGLETLHTQRWRVRGKTGVFANPVWKKFHSELVSKRFNKGEIQLIRLSCADQAIGYLYNYIWQNKIYVLQTGFATPGDSRLMPGYMTHVFAIVHNCGLGMTEYDFLHGNDLYKQVLSNKQQQLHWTVLQKPRLKFRVEDTVLRCVRTCRRYLQ